MDLNKFSIGTSCSRPIRWWMPFLSVMGIHRIVPTWRAIFINHNRRGILGESFLFCHFSRRLHFSLCLSFMNQCCFNAHNRKRFVFFFLFLLDLWFSTFSVKQKNQMKTVWKINVNRPKQWIPLIFLQSGNLSERSNVVTKELGVCRTSRSNFNCELVRIHRCLRVHCSRINQQ